MTQPELTTAQLIEALVVRTYRKIGASPPAVEIAKAAADAAAEFDRIADSGHSATVTVDRDTDGNLRIHVTQRP
jgi:hypothetical protein